MTCNDSVPPPPSKAAPDLPKLAEQVEWLMRQQKRHREVLGSAPDLLSGREGEGLIQAVLELREDLGAVRSSIEALTKTFEADLVSRQKAAEMEATARKERREPWSKAWWIFAGSLIGVLTSASAQAVIHWAGQH